MYVKNRLGRLFNALLFLPTLVRFLRNLKLEDNFLLSEFHNEKAFKNSVPTYVCTRTYVQHTLMYIQDKEWIANLSKMMT